MVKIDKSVPFEHAALFGCGVVTGVGSVINTAQAKPGQFIAVVGLGGVGLSAVLAALAIGSGKVLALDLSEEKLAFARELGVHRFARSDRIYGPPLHRSDRCVFRRRLS